jgi:hypothetical protein
MMMPPLQPMMMPSPQPMMMPSPQAQLITKSTNFTAKRQNVQNSIKSLEEVFELAKSKIERLKLATQEGGKKKTRRSKKYKIKRSRKQKKGSK